MENKISSALKNKFDKTVKKLTNRAIPIVKKEVSNVIKVSSEDAKKDILKTVRLISFGISAYIGFSYLKNDFPFQAASILKENPEQIIINIENLTINT